jgi:hypothetical protein
VDTEALVLRKDEVEIVPVARLKARIQAIQQVMHDVMKEGVHYGTIPGTPKPSLWKPGAEKIATTFGLRIIPEILEERVTEEEVFYRVRSVARNADGEEIGASEGVCSTAEKKYRWRYPTHVKEWEAAPEHRRRIRFDRNGNEEKQVRQEAGDIQNTILQMADKRGYVSVVRKVTAASDIFAQELEEDDDPEQKAEEKKSDAPETEMPKRAKVEEPPATASPTEASRAVQLSPPKKVKSGVSPDGRPWNLYSIKTRDGIEYVTFDQKIALRAEEVARSGERVYIESEPNQEGKSPKVVQIVSVEAA